MTWGYVAVGAGTLIGGYLAGQGASDAGESAANAQMSAATMGINAQQEQFAQIQELLKPYTSAGEGSLAQQQAILGLSGPEAQQQAMQAIQTSPQYLAMAQQGENAILQNASATGGLRGGNVQGALAQFRPQLLSGLIQQQFQNLGGITSIGQNAAAGVGNAGMNTGNQISGLMQQFGAAQAGGYMAQGQAQAQYGQTVSSLGGLLGGYLNRPQVTTQPTTTKI